MRHNFATWDSWASNPPYREYPHSRRVRELVWKILDFGYDRSQGSGNWLALGAIITFPSLGQPTRPFTTIMPNGRLSSRIFTYRPPLCLKLNPGALHLVFPFYLLQTCCHLAVFLPRRPPLFLGANSEAPMVRVVLRSAMYHSLGSLRMWLGKSNCLGLETVPRYFSVTKFS